jgi:conjugal transfer ATP-binding protein TraC
MLDLGRSFEKLCRKSDGQYIEFKPDTDINLNPFSYVMNINEDMDLLHPVICKMASMSQPLEEVQSKAINKAIVHCWRQYGPETTITALQSVFKAGVLPDFDGPVDQRIRDLAIMLEPYTATGVYARYFEGKANVDFSNDFIVIENEELKRKPDLHAVVNMLLLNRITGEMYLTRNRKKVLFIDELKQQLGDIGADDPIKAAVVEEAARRARKYGGSLVTATQQADDYYASRQMEAAFQCSDWLFILRNKKALEQVQPARQDRHGRGQKRLLNSLRLEPGAFSEMYIYSPVGEGIARLPLDPYTRLLFSNRLEDNKPIDERRASGMSIDEAIADVLRERGNP